jgi:hypothetical protein
MVSTFAVNSRALLAVMSGFVLMVGVDQINRFTHHLATKILDVTLAALTPPIPVHRIKAGHVQNQANTTLSETPSATTEPTG